MSIIPVGDRLVVNELTGQEKEDLGFPIGTSDSVDAGIVLAVGGDVEIPCISAGDRVYFRCKAPKVGSESRVIDGSCVIAFVPKEDL